MLLMSAVDAVQHVLLSRTVGPALTRIFEQEIATVRMQKQTCQPPQTHFRNTIKLQLTRRGRKRPSSFETVTTRFLKTPDAHLYVLN